MAKYRYVHYLLKSVRGDFEHFDIWVMSWKWKQFGVNNEQGIYSSYRPIKSCIEEEKKLLIFRHIYQNYLVALKGKSGTGFNLMPEERVNIFEQNCENLMKIGWKIRKLYDTLKFCKFSQNISRNINMNMQMSELIMS